MIGKSRWVLLLVLLATVAFTVSEEQVCAAEDCPHHNSKTWFDDASKEGLKFLQDKVFGQKPKKHPSLNNREDSFGKLTHHEQEPSSSSGDDKGILETLKDVMQAEKPSEALLELFLNKSASHEADKSAKHDTATLFLDNLQEVMNQLQRVVGDQVDALMKDYFFLPSAWYLLRAEQESKHAYWKAAQHKYFDKVSSTEMFKELHQALYLSNLAYVDSVDEVRDGLAQFQDDKWELLFCDVEGNPAEPAHFLAVEKQTAPLPTAKPTIWEKVAGRKAQAAEDDVLNVMIVVRGTKSLGDVLSDGLLEATTFKEQYKAHGGIAKSGQYIVDTQIERLKQLFEASGRSKLQLLLFGHSLGCGTAAIAAMEFKDTYSDLLSVQAVGFGCPALVSPELSEQYKDVITTVVADADVVPRLSGSSIVNLHLDMMSLDWTGFMLEELQEVGQDFLKDVAHQTNGVGTKFASDLLDKLGVYIEQQVLEKIKPSIDKARNEAIPAAFTTPRQRVESDLIPPGTCLHLYRTATGFDAAYTPCTFFHEIEYVPHLVNDHLCGSGYHAALLSLLRQNLQDPNAVYDNELTE